MGEPILPGVRPYRPGDREQVVGMLAGAEPWETLGLTASDLHAFFTSVETGQGREAFVVHPADRDDVVLGAAVLRRRFLVGDYLELFAVAEEARRQGVGRLLITRMEQIVFSRSKNFFLCVSDFNSAGRAFYRRHGFEEVGALPNLLVEGRGEILMRKTIGPARS